MSIIKIIKRIRNFFTKDKKLIMTLLVKDDVDIIKYNIDYHLSHGVDFIIATDTGSIDGTRDILLEYKKKGVLYLIDESSESYMQGEWVNKMSKLAIEKYKADFIFHCDADEFWCPRSGNLKNELLLGIADFLVVDLFNILLEDNEGLEIFPKDTKYIMTKPFETKNFREDSKKQNLYFFKYPSKVMFRAEGNFKEVSYGNHSIISNDKKLKFKNSKDIKIYHFPMRSKKLFFQKAINGGESILKNKELDESIGWHWRRWYNSYKNGNLDNEYKNLKITKEKAIEMKCCGILEDFNFEFFIKNY